MFKHLIQNNVNLYRACNDPELFSSDTDEVHIGEGCVELHGDLDLNSVSAVRHSAQRYSLVYCTTGNETEPAVVMKIYHFFRRDVVQSIIELIM